MAAGCGPDDPAVRAGVEYLTSTQREDGNWDEKEFTGTGFPLVAYLEYPLYRLNFPLMALGMYRNSLKSAVARR
jgi:squalene-hopene/tetraprenyl-beta-curcumene cyclase